MKHKLYAIAFRFPIRYRVSLLERTTVCTHYLSLLDQSEIVVGTIGIILDIEDSKQKFNVESLIYADGPGAMQEIPIVFRKTRCVKLAMQTRSHFTTTIDLRRKGI